MGKLYRIAVYVLVVLLIKQSSVFCSWIHLSPQDLIEKSDLIVIGDILEPVGAEKINRLFNPAQWVTRWEFRIDHVVKGEPAPREITVLTPGAQGSGVLSSTDYRLDMKGKNVVLFLSQSGDNYMPVSPQGIVAVTINANKDLPYRYRLEDKLICSCPAKIHSGKKRSDFFVYH